MDKKLDQGELNQLKSAREKNNNVVCPVCGDPEKSSFFCEVDGYAIYSCRRCSAEYVFPAPDVSTIKAYYDRKEWFEGGEKGGYQDYDSQTVWSLPFMTSALDSYRDQGGLSILDIGCGYGTHLRMAAERGWKCFGVELSDHAREVACSRLGNDGYIVESISELIPHEFDLILILDVIEHLPSPNLLFYELFSIGAITQKTQVIITTPNSGSLEARMDPANWIYRHPPSHLTYYTEKTLSFLFNRFQFEKVQIQGLHPIETLNLESTEKLDTYAGLLLTAQGSDFTEFMRERYVPGTWSKVAEYEHIPRYVLARMLATGKQVLDFGCGTGYGTAMLAEQATEVIGLDIDCHAISWARDYHCDSRLRFYQSDDLGATLPCASFDLITCFEMIEHVDHAMQRDTIASISRLLMDDGVFVISTPNPEVTKLYGENPYHLREMTEREFIDLLSESFSHVKILYQKVRASVSFDYFRNKGAHHIEAKDSDHNSTNLEPLAFIAICSKTKDVDVPLVITFDDTDYILDFIKRENQLHALRYKAYGLVEQVRMQGKELANYHVQAEEMSAQISLLQNELTTSRVQNEELSYEISSVQAELAARR